jgi:rhodanese-related sulfurtransferase
MFGFGVKTITADELAVRMSQGKPVLLDVREPYEFAEGHIRGARNVPLGTLADKAGRLDPGVQTLLICASGHRSARGARQLTKAGFTEVYSVKGGMHAWRGKIVR